MELVETGLPGLLLIKPKAFGDSRGYFFESYQQIRYKTAGINCFFVQDNISRSQQNVLRGLHFQHKQPQDKLVTVTRGEIFDVAIDIRKNSPTFGKSFAVILNDHNHWQLFIPKGFAHGFYVMSEYADFHYKCSDYYQPEFETGIIWNDPALQIKWPFNTEESQPILSTKDVLYTPLHMINPTLLPVFSQ